jgi:very-short-patch-repair endonuclease
LSSHIFRTHKIKDYSFPIRSEENYKKSSERVKGSKNPGYQHGGKYSPWSKKCANYNPDSLKKAQQNNTHTTRLDYWATKADGDLIKAKELLSERQRTFSLKKCIEKYGNEEGTKIWSERQKKWSKNFKRQNYSAISQKLFRELLTYLTNLDLIFFATHSNVLMEGYHNKEYRLTLSNGMTVLPDFLDLSQKKIIEFDGTYWHSEARKNPLREKLREDFLTKDGFMVLRVSEADYRADPQTVIQNCLNFLQSP